MSEVNASRGPGRPALHLPENIQALLGKTSDTQIARIMKCSTTTIANIRKSKGIDKYTPGEEKESIEIPPYSEKEDLKEEMLAQVEEMVATHKMPPSLRKAMKAAVPTAEGWCIPFREYSELLADLMELS